MRFFKILLAGFEIEIFEMRFSSGFKIEILKMRFLKNADSKLRFLKKHPEIPIRNGQRN